MDYLDPGDVTMKILVIGSGGREHAIVHKLVQDGHDVIALPGNPGILAETGQGLWKQEISLKNHQDVSHFARSENVDFTIVGPEQPLAEGIVDHFHNEGLKIFGPTQKAAQLEVSKAYAKHFMQKHAIPTAAFYIVNEEEEARSAAREIIGKEGASGVVLKPDGLTAGKGVQVCEDLQEVSVAIDHLIGQLTYAETSRNLVVEEKLEGQEISILALCDGKKLVPMIPSQDHKRLGEKDTGLNTGGMGAYAPVPFLSDEMYTRIVKELIEPTESALISDGVDYRGILYFGVMFTKQGPKLLEFNCRFGDPETQVVLPLLEGDLGEILLACIEGDLDPSQVTFKDQHACCVVMASSGYPVSFPTGKEIQGLDKQSERVNSKVFYAGVSSNDKGELVTSGGRVLGVTGMGDSLDEAVHRAYETVETLHFDQAYYRKDIAEKAQKLVPAH